MAFEVKPIELTEEPPKWTHGYADEQVIEIKQAYKNLEKKVLEGYKHTLEEFKNIVVPYRRIHRTEEFILNDKPEKPKKEKRISEPKERKVKEPKPVKEKKLTKKQIQEKLNEVIFKMSRGEALTEEEDSFFKSQTQKTGLL
jgi:hypothetical protein